MSGVIRSFEAVDLDTVVPTSPTSRFLRVVGFLYAAEFESGLIKVGRARQVRDRVRQHRASLRVSDGELLRGWFSPEHVNYVQTERSIVLAGQAAASHRRGEEYLYGVNLSALVEVAEGLSYEPPPAKALPQYGPDLPGLMRPRVFAEFFGLDLKVVSRQVKSGELFTHRLGGSHYIPQATVARILKEQQS